MIKSPYTSMNQIRKHNPGFFSAEAMEHYDSKIATGCLKGGYFVTSEVVAGEDSVRKLTARRAMKARDGNKYYPFIENIGSFGEHESVHEAMGAIFRHRALTELQGRWLIEEMCIRVGVNGEAYGVTAFAEPTRGVCLIVSTVPDAKTPLVESLSFESVEALGQVLSAGDNPMDAPWIGQLIEKVVAADELMARALLSSGLGGLAGTGQPDIGPVG